MKQKAIPPFTLTAGQCARLLFNFTLPEGADAPTLRGAVAVSGKKVSMTAVDGGLVIPALPHGVYLAEVRAGASCVLYGHVEVLPSPLFDEEGESAYTVDVDLTTEVLKVEVNLAVGTPGTPGMSAYAIAMEQGFTGTEAEWLASLKGEAGEAGEDGEDGTNGLSAYALAVEQGFTGTVEEWLASLKGEPGNSGMGEEEVESLLHAALYNAAQTVTPFSGTAEDKFWKWCQIDPEHLPGGQVTGIMLHGADSLSDAVYQEPFRLAVWQESDSGEYNFLAVSSNAAQLAAGQDVLFEFSPALTFSGRCIRLIPAAPDGDGTAWEQTRAMKTKVVTHVDDCSLREPNWDNYAPLLTFCVAGSARYAAAEHETNTEAHLTAAERAAWNAAAEAAGGSALTETQTQVLAAFEWDATYGLSLIHKTDDAVDNRLRMLMSATGTTLMTAGTLTVQAAQVAASTRTRCVTWTDSTSGTSYNYGGHTMSETEMAPYGITEACVWTGDPALPLLLRGEEIRINGNVIDVAKLVSLLANADALLALIDG